MNKLKLSNFRLYTANEAVFCETSKLRRCQDLATLYSTMTKTRTLEERIGAHLSHAYSGSRQLR
jgi:hypothetical protein